MTKHDPRGPLLDMRDYALEAQQLVQGHNLDDLAHDRILRLALERVIEIIGEAANRLPLDFRAKHRQIEWEKIIGMRNVLAHGYDVINNEVLWETAKTHIPKLLTQLEELLHQL
ncbi:MAG TPA: HepT-like ribonuclease domain-containing protein [Gallionella sp.]|nr:HepT-like ribonuclease domain-containing protein [Gallionella sp.]